MGSSMNETPKRHILGRKHVVWRIDRQNQSTCAGSARAEEWSKKIFRKGIPKKPQHVFFHVFAQTTHVVAAPHGFAYAGIPATRLYISSFIKIRSGVSEPQGVKIWPFPLLWLFVFTTACTTVQAVISKMTAAAINRTIAISWLQFQRFQRNLAWWRSLTLLTVRTVTNSLKFKQSKTAAAAFLNNPKIAISGNGLTDWHNVWDDDAYWHIKM